MTAEQLQPVEVPRDRFGRPLIIPPHGGRPIPYARCTTYVGALEETYNLGQWQMRMVAAGLASTPPLVQQVAKLGLEPAADPAKKDWKDAITPLVEEALEAAKARDKARRGTEFHAITEHIDRTGDLTGIPEEWKANVDAFMEATRGLRPVAIEQFSVNDDHQVGGTPDRIYEIPGVDGYVIGDLKTGNITYGIGKIAMQLAMYSHSQLYDLTTGQRTPIPGLRTDFGVVMDHDIPAGTCRLVEIDLTQAWDAIQLAKQVRAWRRFATPRNLTRTFVPRAPAATAAADAVLVAAIEQATSHEQLTQLWTQAAVGGVWLERHTALAKTRISHLEGHAS